MAKLSVRSQAQWLSAKWISGAVLATLALGAAVSCATSPTGRTQWLPIPDSTVNEQGAAAFEDTKKKTPIETDPAINAYVKCVVLPLTVAAQDQAGQTSWEVVVFRDPQANAFALPGGKVGVQTGILKVAASDSQLAAVVGHEIGHVIARHGNERMTQSLGAAGLSALAGGLMSDDNPKKGMAMAALGVGLQYGALLPFSRAQESEADLIGEDLMARAGFDPHESIALWQNMMAQSQGEPPQILSTHPASANRIQNLQDHLAPAVAKYNQARAQGHQPHCTRPKM